MNANENMYYNTKYKYKNLKISLSDKFLSFQVSSAKVTL